MHRVEVARCLLAVGRLQFQIGRPTHAMTTYFEARTLLENLDRAQGVVAPVVPSSRRATIRWARLLAAMGRADGGDAVVR